MPDVSKPVIRERPVLAEQRLRRRRPGMRTSTRA